MDQFERADTDHLVGGQGRRRPRRAQGKHARKQGSEQFSVAIREDSPEDFASTGCNINIAGKGCAMPGTG